MSAKLNPDKALIFRITHRGNLGWILRHGLHCASSAVLDPNFITIGHPQLIAKRPQRMIPIPPHGNPSDYIPFYFTPWSPMLLNIKTGYNGIQRRTNAEIAIIVTSLYQLARMNIPFVFSDRHAFLASARFSAAVADLPHWIAWDILQARDFKADPEHPETFERYMAEALIHRHLPISACLGIVCHDQASAAPVRTQLAQQEFELPVHVKPGWYF